MLNFVVNIRMRTLFIILLLSLLTAGSLPACKRTAEQVPDQPAPDSTAMVRELMGPVTIDSSEIVDFLRDYPLFEYHKQEIFSFYKGRHDTAAWFNTYGILEQAGHFIEQLEHFNEEGLKDSIIYFSTMRRIHARIKDPMFRYDAADPDIQLLDCMLTGAFFVYAQKVWYGLSEQTTRSLDWYITRKTVPSVAILDSILSGGSNAFTRFEPLYPQYKLLKHYLKLYTAMDSVTWDSIYLPGGVRSIKPMESYPVLPEIKRRLYLLGDLATADSSERYDSTTMLAAQLFQTRHGLLGDGVLGEKFFREINCSPKNRARQIAVNMERSRWMPQIPSGDYIMVNIPEYIMRIYAMDTLAWQMRVVVGKNSTGTVIFNDELEYIVFSPYWVPPASILNYEILPALKKDASYLSKQHMEAFDRITGNAIDVSGTDWKKYSKMPYSIRQKPGANNSLGWVKFLFPNEHSIYFHDTPSRELFSRESRGFSHGCIRLEKPYAFAEYLLREDTAFTPEIIDSLYYLGKETTVVLPEKIPVYIVYFTAYVGEDGALNFFRDIYGHDGRLEKTLFENSEEPVQ